MTTPCESCKLYYHTNPENNKRRCSGLIDKHSKKLVPHHSQLHDHIVEGGYYEHYNTPQPGECVKYIHQTPEDLEPELQLQVAINYKNLQLCETCKNYCQSCNGELYANNQQKIPPTKVPIDILEQDELMGEDGNKKTWIPEESCPYYRQDMSKQPEKQLWQLDSRPEKKQPKPKPTKLCKRPTADTYTDIAEDPEIADLCDSCKLHHWSNSINPERNCTGKYDLTADKTVRLGQRQVIPLKTPDHYHTPQTDEICPDYQGQKWRDRYEEERNPELCNPIFLQDKEIYRKVYRNIYPNYTGGTPVTLDKSFLPELKWFIAQLKSKSRSVEEPSYVEKGQHDQDRVFYTGYSNGEVLDLANKLKELLETFKDDTILLLTD